MYFIVEQGEVSPLTDENLPKSYYDGEWSVHRDSYGSDWIVVDAADEADALRQAGLFDNDQHPAQFEMEAFAAAYRNGMFKLPLCEA